MVLWHTIRHRIHCESDVVPAVISAPGRRLHADARGNSGQDDLGGTAFPQVTVEIRVDEGTEGVLGYDVIARLTLQLGDELGEIGGKRREIRPWTIGAPSR